MAIEQCERREERWSIPELLRIKGQLLLDSAASAAEDQFQDAIEWDRFEMIAQKVFAGETIIETNETGDTDAAKALINRDATFDSTSGNKTGSKTR